MISSDVMEPACLRHTDLPGTSQLYADFSYRFEQVAGLYRHNPHDPASFLEAAREIQYPEARRAAMADALAGQGNDGELLERFRRSGTAVVVTGQQVGLFSGPAYTIYKALTAVRLAEDLSARGIPAVPLFWLATEDHDLAEVGRAWIFDSAHQPVALEVAAHPGSQQPVGGIHLDSVPRLPLQESLQSFPYADEVAALVDRAYPDGV